MKIGNHRALAAALSVLALAASFAAVAGSAGSTSSAAGGKAINASIQIALGDASGRIEVLRPRGFSGDDQPTSQRVRSAVAALLQVALPQNGIQYHGGPVVMGAKVVSIYWGSSPVFTGGPQPGTTGTAAQDGSLIGYFLSNLGGTPYYNINTTYTDGAGTPIPNSVTYTGFWANNTNVPSDCTPVVSDSAIQQMIASGFASGKLQYDPSTVYAVFSAGKVNLGGNFGNCSGTQFQYCAYHGYFTYNGQTVLYAAMPYNAAYTNSGCTAFAAGGPPNGDPGADAEVNTLAHEIEEANTDPRLNAWWTTSDGSENADKCAWTFGTVNLAGSTNVANTANITVGSRNFLVQRNWLNLNGGACAQTYAGSGPTVPGAPTLNNPTAGNAQVSLSWSAGSTGGAAIDGYYVYRNGVKTNGGALVAGTTFTDTGLTNGVTYSFTVSAHNSVGEGPQSTSRSATPNSPVTVPGAPTLNSATAGNAQVALSWWAPSTNGGAAIDGYYVYRNGVKANSGALVWSTTFTDTGLTNGVTYTYAVSAHNSVGEGPQSTSRSATPNPPVTVPGAPTLNSATAGNAQVALAWSAGSTGGAAIDGYYVYRNGVKTNGGALVAGTTFTDTGLTNGVTYSFTVSAHNSVGEGPQSTAKSATPAAAITVPGAPTLNSATAGNAQVALAWSAGSTGGAAIDGYYVYRNGVKTNGGALVSGTTFTETGLTNGVTYTYTVSAHNSVGEGPQSTSKTATPNVPVTVPGAPTLNSATAGNAQVVLAWSAGSTGGAAIDGYYVYRNGVKTNGGALVSGTTFTDMGLTNGVTYTYTVSAHNSAGEGAQSTSKSATPAAVATAPGAPTLNTATAGDAQVALAWSAGSTGGAAIDGYYVYRNGVKTNGGALVSGTTFTDTGLTNGTTYTFTVSAHNSVGEGPQSTSKTATPNSTSVPGATTVTASTNPRSCFFGFFCSGGGVRLTWTPAAANGSPVTSYRIYRSTTSTVSTAGNAFATVTTTSYTDSATTRGTTYFYKVVAVNAVGPAPDSNVASAGAG